MTKKATKLKERTIWTIGHRPFVMGGTVYYPLGCKVPCTGPYDLGKNYKGYLATSPNGTKFVAEAKTGAIVGPTLEQVRKDIAEGDPAVMKKQVAEAARQVDKVEIVDANFFWGALKAK